MRIAVFSVNNPNIYPALHHLASAFAQAGATVDFISSERPLDESCTTTGLSLATLPAVGGLISRIPILRSNCQSVFAKIWRLRPDWIIAQHEYILPALMYKATPRGRKCRVAGYFSDYYRGLWHTEALRHLADRLDVSVEVCDERSRWRKRDWPKLRADCFVVRQAPHKRPNIEFTAHSGMPRIAFTGSSYVLGMDLVRLGRFLHRLCELEIGIDWYLPGSDAVRSRAQSICLHPLFSVRQPVSKAMLVDQLRQYDAGLHWAPMAESEHDPDYYQSAASNKIGEYIAAGLLVVHAGNPGLSYLPHDLCIVIDPTQPEHGAEQLAVSMRDRTLIEQKRAAAQRYHVEEMNFEKQACDFIQSILSHP